MSPVSAAMALSVFPEIYAAALEVVVVVGDAVRLACPFI
jgi:hypothetical protein